MATSNSKFITNTVIIIVIGIAIGGLAVWRLSPRPAASSESANTESAEATGATTITVNVGTSGYSPSNLTVKQGEKVTLNLVTKNTAGCIRAFVMPTLGISRTLPSSGTTTIEFVATKKGDIPFQCSMGMFNGVITVI